MRYLRVWDNRKIMIVSVTLFIAVCAIVICGYRYMNECTQNESMAQNNRYKFTKLSNDLAETSDFLTNEARKYSDELIKTEACSMRLVLEAENKTEKDFCSHRRFQLYF